MPGVVKDTYITLAIISTVLMLLLSLFITGQPGQYLYTGTSIGVAGTVFVLVLVQLYWSREFIYLCFVILGGLLIHTSFSQDSFTIVGGIAGLAAIMLASRFLMPQQHFPFAWQLRGLLLVINACVAVLAFVARQLAEVIVPVIFVSTVLVILLASLIIQARGAEHAQLFAIAWLVIAIGAITEMLLFLPGVLLIGAALAKKEEAKQEAREELERREAERRRMALAALKKMNGRKDELLDVATQNFQAQLLGVASIAESLRQVTSTKLPADMTEQLDALVLSSRRLTGVVNDLRSYSETKMGDVGLRIEPVKLAAIADKVVEATWPLVQNSQVRLVNRVSGELPLVLVDSDRLHQILLLLTGRMIQQTPAGEIQVTAELTGTKITVRLSSPAAGTPDQLLAAETECQTVKELLNLHGSELVMQSDPFIGRQFSFKLNASGEVAAGSIRSRAGRDIEKIQILIVTESDRFQKELKGWLGRSRWEMAISDAKGVTEALREYPADAVVIGPDLQSVELTRRIRQQYPLTELPLFAITAKGDASGVKEALKAGVNDSMKEPADYEELILRLSVLLQTRKGTREMMESKFILEQHVKERSMALEIAQMNLLTLNEEMMGIEKSRNEMLSAISHELGTPITLIHTYIQATKEGLINQQDPRYLDMIHNKLVLLERLTDDLTELSKYRAGHMSLRFEEVDVVGWFENIAQELKVDVEQSGRSFHWEGVQGQPAGFTLQADTERLGQVFSNIIWNAVKHTKAQTGEISLSATVRSESRIGAVLENTASDGELIITIKDNGPGITPDVLPHIFDRFFKADKSSAYKGSGLGLAIAREITLSHKGEIWAESEVGHGSSFIIALPLTI